MLARGAFHQTVRRGNHLQDFFQQLVERLLLCPGRDGIGQDRDRRRSKGKDLVTIGRIMSVRVVMSLALREEHPLSQQRHEAVVGFFRGRC